MLAIVVDKNNIFLANSDYGFMFMERKLTYFDMFMQWVTVIESL